MNECIILDNTEMPSAPIRKQPISVKLAFLGDMPLWVRYFLADGSMLYNDENICNTGYSSRGQIFMLANAP